jgi:hypothetical protein
MKAQAKRKSEVPAADGDGCLTRVALWVLILVWSVIEAMGKVGSRLLAIGSKSRAGSRQRSVVLSQRFARFRVGALAHYVQVGGRHTLAVITQIGADAELGEAALCVLGGAPGGWFATAFFDPDTKARGTWHWIEGSLARTQSSGGNLYREL